MPQSHFKPLQGGALVILTLALSLATFMQVLDSTIANVAIPTIAGDLGASSSQGTWVITSFGVANAISIPITGWLAKRFGEVRLLSLLWRVQRLLWRVGKILYRSLHLSLIERDGLNSLVLEQG